MQIPKCLNNLGYLSVGPECSIRFQCHWYFILQATEKYKTKNNHQLFWVNILYNTVMLILCHYCLSSLSSHLILWGWKVKETISYTPKSVPPLNCSWHLHFKNESCVKSNGCKRPRYAMDILEYVFRLIVMLIAECCCTTIISQIVHCLQNFCSELKV